jgi:hypothetical protein
MSWCPACEAPTAVPRTFTPVGSDGTVWALAGVICLQCLDSWDAPTAVPVAIGQVMDEDPRTGLGRFRPFLPDGLPDGLRGLVG